MDKKYMFIFLIAILVVAIGIFFFTKNISQSPTDLEKCNTLIYNGEDKPNIVFFSSEDTAKRYIEGFFKISPFDKNKNGFNFYSIDYTPECELYKGIAILCYSKEVIKKAASCPNDYIVVTKDKPSNIRSSAYMNVVSLNSNSNINVFAHEFGHAFANLADEYVPAKIPKGSKNCQKTCDKFNTTECLKGCSEESYYRSIDSGLMRTLFSSTYGTFNEELIKSKITNTITGNAIQDIRNCKNEKYYLVEGNYKNGEISVNSKSIESGCVGENGNGAFSYQIILDNNEKAKTENFNPELVFTDLTQEEQLSGGPQDYSGSFLLKVPILENSNKLEIINEDKITEINLKDIGARPCEI